MTGFYDDMRENMRNAVVAVLDDIISHHDRGTFNIIRHWPDIAGEAIDRVTKIERFERGILYVKCENSAYAHEFSFLKKQIIQSLRDRLPEHRVRDIRFRAGIITK